MMTRGDGVSALQRDRLIAAALAATVAIVYFFTLRDGHSWGDDFSQYIRHGINLATGRPFDELPYAAWAIFDRPHAVPPLFPALIAVVYKVWGLNLTAFKTINVVMFASGLGVLFLAFRQRLSLTSRVALVVLLAANPFFWDFKDEILSDLPFLLTGSLALWAVDRSLSKPGHDRAWPDGVIVGLAIVLAVASRPNGNLIVIAGIIASLMARRRITPALWTALPIVAAFGALEWWLIPGMQHSTPHAGPIVTHAIFYAKTLTRVWDNGHSTAIRYALFLMTSALALRGLAEGGLARPRVWEIFGVLAFVLLLPLPYAQGMRYLIPIVPIYLMLAFMGLDAVVKRATPSQRAIAFATIVVAGLATYAGQYSTMQLTGRLPGIADPEPQALFAFIRANASPTDVIEFRRPRALALFTGHLTGECLPDVSEDVQWRGLRDQHITMIALQIPDLPEWTAFVTRHESCWTNIYATPAYRVYRVNDPTYAHAPCGPGTQ